MDSLLNFAGTPRGCVLLFECGEKVVQKCFQYMLYRYKKKLQVGYLLHAGTKYSR